VTEELPDAALHWDFSMRIALLCLLAAVLPAAAQNPKRIFIDSFGDKPGASDLRDQVSSEMRKSPAFRIVSGRPDAEFILTGTGEIWVKSHYSMNPRNRTISSSQAVYTGYLSVELQDKKGETLWSYLATPHSSGTHDVAGILARLAVTNLLRRPLDAPAAPPAIVTRMTTLNGAGATFPYPVYAKWFEAFHRMYPDIDIHYDPVGSETGMKRLMDGDTDFAGSDVMVGLDEYFAGGKPKYLRFPAILGAVVPVYNLAEVPIELKFTPEILAGIYLGKIRRWNDPRIQAVNHGAMLMDRDITVIHRADGSGTSYVWTDYLSKISPEWKTLVGVDSAPNWPVGVAAQGNEGVAKMVRETPGSIGYVEYIYAITNKMTYGSVRNSAGRYISPNLETILEAARGSSSRIAEDFQTSITNSPELNAYPVSGFTWFVVPATVKDADRKAALKEFLEWMISAGQHQAAAMGYVSVAPEVLVREQQAVEKY
jgi:phosphate transport system substrate-binding protein